MGCTGLQMKMIFVLFYDIADVYCLTLETSHGMSPVGGSDMLQL